MAKFSNMHYRRALMLFLDDVSITDIADQLGTTRQSITKWKKEGWPVEITGGKDWADFRDTERATDTRRAMERHAKDQTQTSLQFFETAKEDIVRLFDEAKLRLMSGEGKVQFADIEKLMNIFIRLDNQAADKVLWMQEVMTQMIRAVAEVIQDEREFLRVRNRFIQIAAEQQRRLGPIPGAVELPTPAEIGVGVDLYIDQENPELLITYEDTLSHPDDPPSVTP